MFFWIVWGCHATTGDSGAEATATLAEGGVRTCANPAARDEALFDPVSGPGVFDPDLESDLQRMGVAAADLDGDGTMDILTGGPQDQTRIFMSRGDTWVEEDERLPIQEPIKGAGMSFVDLDADGDLDLAVPRADGPTHLWENDGSGFFIDITADRGIPLDMRTMHQVSWGDIDQDGDLDALVLDFVGNQLEVPDQPSSRSELWTQQDDGRFEISRARLPTRAEMAWLLAGGLIDLNGDRLPDVYAVADFGRTLEANVAAINSGPAGGSVFVDAPELGLNLGMSAMGLAVADLNDDALPDFAISDTANLPIMVSMDGAWFEQGAAMGLIWHEGAAWGIGLEDMDNNGEVDVVFAVGPAQRIEGGHEEADAAEHDELFLQEDGQWRRLGEEWSPPAGGQGAGLAVVDLDGDGWLDLVRAAWKGPYSILRARCGAEAWLTVDLEQAGLNRDAIGAEVVVESGGRRWRSWVLSGVRSFATGLPPELHFGLGDLDEVDRIRVVWPDGTESEVGPVQTRQRVRITRL